MVVVSHHLPRLSTGPDVWCCTISELTVLSGLQEPLSWSHLSGSLHRSNGPNLPEHRPVSDVSQSVSPLRHPPLQKSTGQTDGPASQSASVPREKPACQPVLGGHRSLLITDSRPGDPRRSRVSPDDGPPSRRSDRGERSLVHGLPVLLGWR